ncbi:autophagy-related protein 13-domain-containing protein [Mrakia frigida]|uniref:autophagy-related protein 13-domain-containing protein n=1 Tax=Mrakia frigida TaxID=29902 RepID=UPI003FCC0FD3
MSSSRPPQSKSDQLAQQWFKKACQTLCESRLTGFDPPKSTPSPSRWFNLDLPAQDHFKQELIVYRSISLTYPPPSSSAEISGAGGTGAGGRGGGAGGAGAGRSRGAWEEGPLGKVPAFVIEFVLDLTAVGENQVLMFEPRDGESGRIKTRRSGGNGRNPNFVIERWRIGLDTNISQTTPFSHLNNSGTYKRLIPLFRALYTLLRLLPAHRLQRRIRGGRRATGFRIGAIAYQEGHAPRDSGCVGLEEPIELEGGLVEEELEKWEFEGVEHMYGNFTLQGSYRPNLQFYIEDKDTVASSNLLNEDYFTPSMAQQPKSTITATTSSTTRTSPSLPKPEPRPISSAQTTPFPSQLALPDSLPPESVTKPRQFSATYAQRPKFGSVSSRAMLESLSGGGSGSGSGASGRSFTESGYGAEAMERGRRSSDVEERVGVPVPLDSRARRSSFYGDDKTSHSPSSLSLGRRPTLNSIQTFRSGTLSSSPLPSPAPFRSSTNPTPSSYTASPSSSLMQPRPSGLSSLSREVGSHMQQPIPISRSNTSSAASQYPPLPLSMPDSPRSPSSGGGTGSTPTAVPSSSSSTTPAVPIAPPMSKRYSSSFGHRQGRSFSTLSSSVASSITRQQVAAPITRTGSGGGSGGSLTRGQSILSAANSALEADAELAAFVNLIDSRPTLSAPLTLGSSSFLPSPISSSSLARVSLTASPQPTTKSQLSEALKRMAASYTGFGPASSGTVLEGIESSSSATSPSGLSPPTSSTGSQGGLHLNISPPTKRSLATSPIAPSPLRASTEAPSFAKSSVGSTSSPLAGPSSTSSFATSASPNPILSTLSPLSSSPADKLRSPRERKPPVLMRGGFSSLGSPGLAATEPSDVPLPSSMPNDGGGRWSPNLLPLGSPNASSLRAAAGSSSTFTGPGGFASSLSRDGSRSPSLVGTNTTYLPSTAGSSRTPSQSPGPSYSRQHHLPQPHYAYTPTTTSNPPIPTSPLSTSPPLSLSSAPFALSAGSSSPPQVIGGGFDEAEEDDVLGRFELGLDEEPPVTMHSQPTGGRSFSPGAGAAGLPGGRAGSVGRKAGLEYHSEVGSAMGRSGGWTSGSGGGGGYGRSG